MKQINLMVFIIGIVLLIHPVAAEAADGGSIHGTITGGDNPIVGATVRLLEFDRVTRTDGKGEFLFSNIPNGTYNVFVRVIGYSSATNTIQVTDHTAETSFQLHESAIEEEEIVVSASPYARTGRRSISILRIKIDAGSACKSGIEFR